MSLPTRQHALAAEAPLPSAWFPTRNDAASLGAWSSPGDRLARQQLWREVPTFVGVLLAILGALFL